MTTIDSLSPTPTRYELQVAYLRKFVISLGPVLLAGVMVLSNAADAGGRITSGVTWISALLAIAGAAGTFFPSNAVAKLVASLAAAIGQAIVAAVTDGQISMAEGLLVLTQILAWTSAGVVANGPAPRVAQGVTAVLDPR